MLEIQAELGSDSILCPDSAWSERGDGRWIPLHKSALWPCAKRATEIFTAQQQHRTIVPKEKFPARVYLDLLFDPNLNWKKVVTAMDVDPTELIAEMKKMLHGIFRNNNSTATTTSAKSSPSPSKKAKKDTKGKGKGAGFFDHSDDDEDSGGGSSEFQSEHPVERELRLFFVLLKDQRKAWNAPEEKGGSAPGQIFDVDRMMLKLRPAVPTIFILYGQCESIRMTEAMVERLFSTSEYVTGPRRNALSDEMLSLLTRARGRWNGDLQPSVNSIKGKYEGITIQNNVNAGALTQVDSTVLLS